MSKHGTISSEFPGWYVQFQTDVLLQLPRPGEISKSMADKLHDGRGLMKKALRSALCPNALLPATNVVFSNLFRDTGELRIQLPALKRPTLEELQSKYDWIKSIERDTSTEEPLTLSLATVLVPSDGNSIDGKEYEKRIALKHDALLGFQHMAWLLEHRNEFPEFMTLLGKVYIDFPGIVVVSRGGNRNVPYCGQVGSRWGGGWSWLSFGFCVFGRVAFSK